jgi:hypothetical protein
MTANGSALLPIAWPQSISNQKNKTADAIATVAATRGTIVILLICKLNLSRPGPIWDANHIACRPSDRDGARRQGHAPEANLSGPDCWRYWRWPAPLLWQRLAPKPPPLWDGNVEHVARCEPALQSVVPVGKTLHLDKSKTARTRGASTVATPIRFID